MPYDEIYYQRMIDDKDRKLFEELEKSIKEKLKEIKHENS